MIRSGHELVCSTGDGPEVVVIRGSLESLIVVASAAARDAASKSGGTVTAVDDGYEVRSPRGEVTRWRVRPRPSAGGVVGQG